MTLPLGSDPFADLMGQLGLNNGKFNPDEWLASVDQPTIPPAPPEGVTTRNEPNTVAAPPGAAASGGSIGIAIDAAEKFLGRDYQWGGNGQNGNSVDCSGLLYAAFRAAGFNIQRYRAVDYGHMGTPVDPGDARPGDIVYFDNPGTDTDHVGIFLGNNQFIEAPRPGEKVQISKLRGGAQIRRIFPDSAYGGLATTPTGNFVVNTAGGKRFEAPGKSTVGDPVAQVMSQLGQSTDPDALISGLNAKGRLDDLLSQPFMGLPAAGQGNPVPARESQQLPAPSGHGGITIGQVSGLSPAEAYIIQHESGGDPSADNPTSTAFGIWQGLQGTRNAYAARFGFDPNTTDVNQQLTMFRQYVKDRYGTAENAEQFWRTHHWY